jgi:hypothetical protein
MIKALNTLVYALVDIWPKVGTQPSLVFTYIDYLLNYLGYKPPKLPNKFDYHFTYFKLT